jgi:hypothetical protein
LSLQHDFVLDDLDLDVDFDLDLAEDFPSDLKRAWGDFDACAFGDLFLLELLSLLSWGELWLESLLCKGVGLGSCLPFLSLLPSLFPFFLLCSSIFSRGDLSGEPGGGFADFGLSVFECLMGWSLGDGLQLALDDEFLGSEFGD